MDNKTFEKIVNDQFEECKRLLCSKSKEYDFGEDRLHSFKVAGQLLKSTPEEALLGYMTKHIISICDLIPEIEKTSYYTITEKINDTINYLLLLKALIYERKFPDERKN